MRDAKINDVFDPTLTVIFLLQLQTDHLAALDDAEV
jgi:hypothetical protein